MEKEKQTHKVKLTTLSHKCNSGDDMYILTQSSRSSSNRMGVADSLILDKIFDRCLGKDCDRL